MCVFFVCFGNLIDFSGYNKKAHAVECFVSHVHKLHMESQSCSRQFLSSLTPLILCTTNNDIMCVKHGAVYLEMLVNPTRTHAHTFHHWICFSFFRTLSLSFLLCKFLISTNQTDSIFVLPFNQSQADALQSNLKIICSLYSMLWMWACGKYAYGRNTKLQTIRMLFHISKFIINREFRMDFMCIFPPHSCKLSYRFTFLCLLRHARFWFSVLAPIISCGVCMLLSTRWIWVWRSLTTRRNEGRKFDLCSLFHLLTTKM